MSICLHILQASAHDLRSALSEINLKGDCSDESQLIPAQSLRGFTTARGGLLDTAGCVDRNEAKI